MRCCQLFCNLLGLRCAYLWLLCHNYVLLYLILNWLRYLVNKSFLHEYILSRLAHRYRWCCNRILGCNLLLLVVRYNSRCFLHKRVFDQFLVTVQIVEQLVHDFLRLLLVDLHNWLFNLDRFLWLQTRVEHKLVYCLLVLGEFSTLLLAFLIVLLVIPNFAAVVLIPKSVVINNKIVVPPFALSTFVLIAVNLLEHILRILDLQKLSYVCN